jgi:hypothetical protein
LVVVGERAGKLAVEQTVKTPDGARTMGLDKMKHQIYLPTAELEAATSQGRPKPKPNTFKIVVVARQ